MNNWGPLQCDNCGETVQVCFEPGDEQPIYKCACTTVSTELTHDMIDSPDSLLEDWSALP